MRLLVMLLTLYSLSAFATDTVNFRNDREGESFYQTRSNERALSRAYRHLDREVIEDAFNDVLIVSKENKLCAFDINDKLLLNLKRIDPGFDDLDGAIFSLRFNDQIDDSVTKILLSAHQTQNTQINLPKNYDELYPPSESRTEKILPIIARFKDEYLKNSCFDEAYRNLYSEIIKNDKGIKGYHLEALFVEAHVQNLIDTKTYLLLEKARVNDLQYSGLNLKTYYQKIKSLRNQYPLRDPSEKSNFVTQKVNKMDLSRRQRLLENYTDIQIIMMGNIIKKLRTRLESPKVEILIYDRSNEVETITLEPMERFRLAIKLLRKEMSYVSLNTYFSDRSPDYMDLVTAAYETGIIPASEVDELGSLQDIWNPKKSFWEKARVWVQTLSSVATIAIPPPYGFIPALAIVVIEATAGQKKDSNGQDPTSLF